MITDADVKKLEKTFVTKEYLNEYLNEKLDSTEKGLKKEIRSSENYLNYKIDTLEKKVDDFKAEFTGFKDSVLKSLDWLVGAFTKFEEEHTVLTEQNGRANGKLDNHEARISDLEYAHKS
ncbi:MAG: hypothetical protein WC894_04610 [Patescibacteria group bacterium]